MQQSVRGDEFHGPNFRVKLSMQCLHRNRTCRRISLYSADSHQNYLLALFLFTVNPRDHLLIFYIYLCCSFLYERFLFQLI